MTRIFLLSGPIAVGKTALVKEFETRFGARKVSTRQLLLQELDGAGREQLIELGLKLDKDTKGRWVADAFREAAGTDFNGAPWLIDAVRTPDQVKHFRDLFGDRVVHIHLDAPIETLRQRYADRPAGINEFGNYDEAKLHGTEQNIGELASIADRVLETDRNDPPSLLAQAVGGLQLFPESVAALVDVVVGAQYGSEGKGNICAHIAGDYQVLMRVGGPNAGHKVAHPEYTYVQLPSGTLSNPNAKLLIGAGATLAIRQVLTEIAELGLTPDRLSIDPQAIIIEDGDVELEVGSLEIIGSTKKGVGVATARKILGRGSEDYFGIPVRLARDIPEFEGFIRCTKTELENAYAAGHRILLEGTQGTDLSIHHGQYPKVTSREPCAKGPLEENTA